MVVHKSELLQLVFVQINNSHQKSVVGIHINVDLVDDWSLHVNGFKFSWGNELACLELDHFFHSVDQLDSTVLLEDCDISKLEPSVIGKSFLGQFWFFVISLED